MADRPLIVTGGNGRIGRLLRSVWKKSGPKGLSPIFLSRHDWDIGTTQAPSGLPEQGVVLDLSARRDAGGLSENPDIAASVARFARERGHRLIHMSSAAVYAGGPLPQEETAPLAPYSAYGESKRDAEVALRGEYPDAVVLRLANLAGADALLGQASGPVVLDPIPDGNRGPIRSYIGPITFAAVLKHILAAVSDRMLQETVLNIAQPGPVAMADLLDAQGRHWRFGPRNSAVLPQMVVATVRLERLYDLSKSTPESLVAEVQRCEGWP